MSDKTTHLRIADDASEAVTPPITSLTCEHGVVPSPEGMLFRKLVVSELCRQRKVFWDGAQPTQVRATPRVGAQAEMRPARRTSVRKQGAFLEVGGTDRLAGR